MALPSYYSTGTASVTQGQTVVTGASTAWTAPLRAGDLFGIHVGLAVPIASVDSDTQLTLAYVWPGATQSAAAYAVQIIPDVARMQETTRQVLQQIGEGNLQALAGLTGAADKGFAFSGAGTMEEFDFNAIMRAMLGLEPAADQIAYFKDDGEGGVAPDLTPLTAFSRTVLGTATDDAARTVLNAFGAKMSSSDYVADANALTVSGAYAVGDTWSGSPIAGTAGNNQGTLIHAQWANDAFPGKYAVQRFSPIGGGILTRYNNNGAWSAWSGLSIVKRTLVTSSGTFNFDTRSKSAVIEILGGGAGGGGASAAGTASAAGGGGGAGAYVSKLVDLTTGIVSASLSIGGGGLGSGDGGTSTYNDGTNSLSAGGGHLGATGPSSTAAQSAAGGAGGTPTGGEVRIPGGSGKNGLSMGSNNFSITWFFAVGGAGGDSVFGPGGATPPTIGATAQTHQGGNGGSYGAGGSGASSVNAGGSVAGGSGVQGVAIITEYQ